MINEEGGSVHDPAAVLPPPMWAPERGMKLSGKGCGFCRERHGSRNVDMHALTIREGPHKGVFYACRKCDGGPSS